MEVGKRGSLTVGIVKCKNKYKGWFEQLCGFSGDTEHKSELFCNLEPLLRCSNSTIFLVKYWESQNFLPKQLNDHCTVHQQ